MVVYFVNESIMVVLCFWFTKHGRFLRVICFWL